MKNGIDSIRKQTGVLYGTITLTRFAMAYCLLAAFAACAGDYALDFSSASQIVTSSAKVTTTNFTFEAWFKVTTFIGENQVFAQYAGGHSGRMIVAVRNTKPGFFINGVWLDSNATVASNTWTHIAVTRSGTTGTIYINGILDKTGTVSGNALPVSGISIGNISLLQNGFRGQIADVRAWSVARTQPEIYAALNTRLSGSESGLVVYWPINDSTGTSVDELVANADGTMAGTPQPAWIFSDSLPLVSSIIIGAWNTASGGNWSGAANWLASTVPDGDGHWASFTNQPAAALAVTNDLSPLLVGRMFLVKPAGVTFTGNALTFINASFQATLSATDGNHAFELPVVVGNGGLSVDTRTPAAVSFSNVLSGSGALTVNPATSSGGSVSLSGANTYTGPTMQGSGTLLIPSLADGGSASAIGVSSADPANLVIGPGTLRYTGPDASIDRGFSVNPGSRKAALLYLDHDLTITGSITNQSGAFIKTGPGTLAYAAPVASLIGRQQSAGLTTQAAYPANGDSPANGFGCFTVAGGKVVLGAHPAQTNLFSEEVTVGAYTTDQLGQEVAAELEIVGGYTRFNGYFDIGYYNGNTFTAPTPLQPTVTVSGGTVSATGLIIAFGYQTNQNTRAVLNVAGGSMTVDNEIRFGDQRGAPESPMHATINVSSGLFRHTSTSAGLRMGWRSPAANATLNITGGLLDEYADVIMAQNGNTSTLYLGGGTLRMRNITHNSTNGTSLLTLNGGFLQPRAAGYTLSGLTSVTVSTNGALIDTSIAPYTIAQNLLHAPALDAIPDGGLVKTGTNALTLAFTNATYTGVTRVSEGTLRVTGSLPPNNTVAIQSAGELRPGGNATQTLAVAALDLAPGAMIGFTFKADGTSNDRLALVSAPTSFGTTRIALYRSDTSLLPFTLNGTYTLITYSGTAPDISGLTCANPVPGKSYAFAVTAGAITVTVGNGSAVWNTDADGAWSTAANWTTTPASGDPVRFDEVITAPRTITTAGQTAGGLSFNNANAYTLGGSGLTLSSGTTITVEKGAHTVVAPLALADSASVALSPGAALTLGSLSGTSLTAQGNGSLNLTAAPALDTLTLDVDALNLGGSLMVTPSVALVRTVTVSPATNASASLSGTLSGEGGLTKSGSSTLTLGTANTYTGVTTVKGGTLSFPALANGGATCSIGRSSTTSANLNLGGGTLHYSGPSTSVNRGFTVNPGSGKAAILRLDNDLTVSGWINNTAGGFIKTGPGTLRYTLTNTTSTLGANQSSTMGTQGPYPANGDAPANGFGCFTLAQGKVILGAPSQTNIFNAEVTIGTYTTSQAGQETTGELEFVDGHSIFKALLDIGYYNGTTLTAPTPLHPTVTVSGGTVTALGMIISFGYNNFGSAYPNTHGVLNIAGGTLTVTGSDFRFGDQTGSGMLATINVTTGALIHSHASAGMGSNRGGNNTLNLYGGLVDEYADLKMGANGSTSRVNLHGGILRVRNITASTGSEYLTFNGGTFQPRQDGQTLADALLSAVVSTNGAVVDTSLASYTVAQQLTHDPILGGTADGGLVKLGTNTLSLTSTGNTFNGPVRITGGLLRARLGGTNDLFVATNGVFDALAQRATVSDLTGEGLLTNGVIAVTGMLDAGTNNAPAGAKMTVQNLSLVGGSTFSCDWATNALGQVTNDFATVTGTLAAEGQGFFDMGRTEANPITLPFKTTILSYGSFSGSFAGWKATHTGLPAGKSFATVATAVNGLVTLELRYSGTLLMVK